MCLRHHPDSRDIEAQRTEPLLCKTPTPECNGSKQGGAAGVPANKEMAYPHSPRQTALLVVVSVALLAVAAIELGAALPLLRLSIPWHFPGSPSYPRFLVLGDWGREGKFNQTVVAEAMARKAASFRPDFIVSTGDNFYESGLVSVDDPGFNTSFVEVYNQSELQVPWHVVLGNHDYGETRSSSDTPDCPKGPPRDECFFSPVHQLDIRLAARDQRWHCERSFTLSLASAQVDIFFIDTTPIISNYKSVRWADNRGGVLQQSWEDQVRELEARLARSTAPWKLVVGHHPIRTNHRPDHMFGDMVDAVEPLLIKYGVQAYFCGHDHNLQHIHTPRRRYHQVTSGAGSQVGTTFYGHDDSPFQYGANGFAAVTVAKASMRVEYLGVDSDLPLFAIDIPLKLTN